MHTAKVTTGPRAPDTWREQQLVPPDANMPGEDVLYPPVRPSEYTAPPVTGADRLAYAFYTTAATAALVGQVWAGVTHIPWPEAGFPMWVRIAVVTPAVAVIELGGVATAALADLRRRKGEQAYAYRAMSLFAALVALVFNVVGHWRPDERFLAFGFGGLSAFAYALWLIHSSARRRDTLRAAGQMASTSPVYGLVQWLREPRVTWLARSLALEHGYGLYESLRQSRERIRSTARRMAIAGTVAEFIRSDQQDERLAKIAETTYDPDRIATMLEKRVDYEVVTNKLTKAIEPRPEPTPTEEIADEPSSAIAAQEAGAPSPDSGNEEAPDVPHGDSTEWWFEMAELSGVTRDHLLPRNAPAAPADPLLESVSGMDAAPAETLTVTGEVVSPRAIAQTTEKPANAGGGDAPEAPELPGDRLPAKSDEGAGARSSNERTPPGALETTGGFVEVPTQQSEEVLPNAESVPVVSAPAPSPAPPSTARRPRGGQGRSQERSGTSSDKVAAAAAARAPKESDLGRPKIRKAPRDAHPSAPTPPSAADIKATAFAILDKWPADLKRTGKNLAREIQSSAGNARKCSESYARKCIAWYDQERSTGATQERSGSVLDFNRPNKSTG
jgi:hypothetical protein